MLALLNGSEQLERRSYSFPQALFGSVLNSLVT